MYTLVKSLTELHGFSIMSLWIQLRTLRGFHVQINIRNQHYDERKHTHSCTMRYWYAVHMCDSLITGAQQEKGEKEVVTVFYCQKCFLKHKKKHETAV